MTKASIEKAGDSGSRELLISGGEPSIFNPTLTALGA